MKAAALIAAILWVIIALPFMLLGCVCGYLFQAFMDGVKQGRKDWREWHDAEDVASGDAVE